MMCYYLNVHFQAQGVTHEEALSFRILIIVECGSEIRRFVWNFIFCFHICLVSPAFTLRHLLRR